MKQTLFLVLACFSLLACSGSSSSLPTTVIHEELHIGEYLQSSKDPKLFYTFARDGKKAGLVSVNIETKALKLIDSEAAQGRDLMFIDQSWIYRLDTQIVRHSGGERFVTPSPKIRRLRSATKTPEDEWEYIYDNESQSFIVCGNSRVPMAGIGLKTFQRKDAYFTIVHYQNELILVERAICESSPIRSRKLAEQNQIRYLGIWKTEPQLELAFLDELKGQLFWLTYDYESETSKLEVIDGLPGENFVGMDIAFFKDGDRPGIVYLDAWALKIKMARFQEAKWKSWKLNVPGAVGFYNQARRLDETRVEILFHAYRTQLESLGSSFENLVRTEVQLDELP